MNRAVDALASATLKGTSFVYGYVGGASPPFTVTDPGSAVTFRVPGAAARDRHVGAVRVAVVLARAARHRQGDQHHLRTYAGTRGPAASARTANIFLGQVEALCWCARIARMNRFELLVLMTAGMATIAGSVMVIYASMLGAQFQGVLGQLITKSIMSVPGRDTFRHVMLPDAAEQDHGDSSHADLRKHDGRDHPGHRRRAQHYLSILAILIVLIAFVALVNGAIGALPDVGGAPLTLERITGWIFAPLAWLMGIPWREALTAGSLLGIKTVLNEFIAFLELAKIPPEVLSDRSA